MRATTVFNKLLALQGVWVNAVDFGRDRVIVDVVLRRRLRVCPQCGWSTAARHNWQRRPSTWRALDLGVWQVTVRCRLRRLRCQPCRRVVVEAVPFARHKARFTRDIEDLIAWLAQRCDKTAITQLCRINWRTVGAIIDRLVADQLLRPARYRPVRRHRGDKRRHGRRLPQGHPRARRHRRHRVHRHLPRDAGRQQGPGRGPPGLLERAARAGRPRGRPHVQACPLGAAEAARAPHRHPDRPAGGHQARPVGRYGAPTRASRRCEPSSIPT